MTEFLPLCDVLFNVISLAGYFCDVVFDLVLGYALFKRGRYMYFATVIVLVGFSLIITQVVSLRWYQNKWKKSTTSGLVSIENKKKLTAGQTQIQPDLSLSSTTMATTASVSCTSTLSSTSRVSRVAVITLHCTQMGVLWRYAKLFVPVDLRHVKHEVRDLCMLRLVHAFCEAAPMLLLQLHVLIGIQTENDLSASEVKLKSLGETTPMSVTANVLQSSFVQQSQVNRQYQEKAFRELNIVSAALSLFSVCWALASFSKNVRLQNVHRLVLTWLGVIFQFFWRLGTVTSRVISLTVYASFYSHWIFLVIVLHWFSMFLWLISPKNVFHGEKISRARKSALAGMIAFVYVFAYINLQEVNHRQKMVTFYVVMFLENCLLVCLWMVGVWQVRSERWYMVPILVFATFVIGMMFMWLYYRFFHVRRLGYEAGGRIPTLEYPAKCRSCANPCKCGHAFANTRNGGVIGGSGGSRGGTDDDGLKYSHVIPGVFNCRFSNPVGNGATKRKKKKPTTFIPPPTLNVNGNGVAGGASVIATVSHPNEHQIPEGPMVIPFWRRPLPRSHAGSSETEGSCESRVNIHQKLQEKKQKQLAELKIIEEEIKQGKLGGPAMGTLSSGDDGKASLPRQPIPRTKKHIDLEPIDWHSSPCGGGDLGDGDSSLINFNIMSLPSLDDTSKYSNCGYVLNGMNISGLKDRNMSPISSSQMSPAEGNSLTKQVHARATKIPHTRNMFPENYRPHLGSVAAHRPLSISPLNTSGASGAPNGSQSPANRPNLYHNGGGIYLETNHPRQISGTYSSSVENSEHLPFPYNVIPPPRSKLDSRLTPNAPTMMASPVTTQHQQNNLNASSKKRQFQRAKTPEILLAPHYLENSRIYYDWMASDHRNQQIVSSGDENLDVSAADESVSGYGQNQNRIPSDIDSQVSLPRSYTLPREFKYYRRNKARKFVKNENFIASTNSSDGK